MNKPDLAEKDILEGAYDGVIRIDQQSRILYANTSAHTMFGYATGELIGHDISILMTKHHAQSHSQFVAGAGNNAAEFKMNRLRRLRARKKSGELFPIDININIVNVDNKINYIAFIRDMSDIVAKEEELHRHVYFDLKTNTPNSAALRQYLTAIYEGDHSSDFRIVIIAPDRMNTINSAFGMDGGDLLIQSLAKTLPELFPYSPIIARLRGRYFAVVTQMSADEVESVIPKLSARISERFAQKLGLRHTAMLATCSAGCLEFPSEAGDTDQALDLMEAARSAMNDVAPGLLHRMDAATLNQRIKLSSMPFRIASALEKSEFQLFVQPKENVTTRSCSGGEFLIRWQSGGTQVEGPHVFIPIAESAGLIRDIGRFLIGAACEYIESLPQSMKSLNFALNASALELRHGDYAQNLLDSLAVHGICVDRLEIELTESAIATMDQVQWSNLMTVKNAGIKIALDDFGTGTSSLAALYDLPVDRVKLDRRFLKGIERDENRRILVGRAIDLARSLGKAVTVEGVETAEVRDLIADLGADEIQGFYYGRPQPFDEFRAFAAERQPPG